MPYTAEERLYLDADGNVVKEGDPKAATLLVGAGGQLSDEDARRYGLVQREKPAEDAEQPATDEKAQTAPRPNKARTAGENK
jgi:hypothetical protein